MILGILLVVLLAFFMLNKGKISGNVIANSQISFQTENSLQIETDKINYPPVYFTLISIQKEISNQSAVSEIPQEITTEPTFTEDNTTAIVENPIVNETDNSSLEQTLISENETLLEKNITLSSEPSSEVPTTETLPIETTNSDSSTSSTVEENSAPISEGVSSEILKTVSNFFLGFLKPTGMAVSEQSINGEIKGQVSANNPFSYSLKSGEEIQLLSGSVKTDSKPLLDKIIQIVYEGNNVIISTNYSEVIKSNILPNSTDEQVNFNMEQLSEKEKEILNKEFGNYSIEITKSELFNKRYVLGYKLGDYAIEYSYNPNLNNEILKTQIEKDKIKWLRDIITKLSSNVEIPQDYSLGA